MAILDLKSNLSQWRKPTTVEAGEKKKLSESPVKAVYSTSTDLTKQSDIKINKVDNSTSIQVPGAKKIDYKLFSINSKRNRGIPAISTLFGDKLLPKISKYKEQRPKELAKVSEYVKITPRGIQHISTIQILKTILKDKASKYKEQFPKALPKVSEYIDQTPRALPKISEYIDQIPRPLPKISEYIDQIPRVLPKISEYIDQTPRALDKISEYIKRLIDNKNSLYYPKFKIARLARMRPATSDIRKLYAKPLPPVVNGFDDLTSGVKGFIQNQKEGQTAFLGLDTDALTYTYPITVREGRQKDITKIKKAQQWPSDVTFGGAPYSTVPSTNNLAGTKYTRTVYNINKPYLTSAGITGTDLFTYFNSNSFKVRNIEYSAFNLRDSSFNTGNGAIFDSPLILTGIQRKDFVKTGFRFWETWKFDDGFIRGGVVTSTQRAIVDVLRIGKWYASAKGLLFIARQAGLQASAPITEADPFVGKRAANGALTLASSLINTATQHLGLRFRKDGLPIAPRNTYSTVMFGKGSNGRGTLIVTQNPDNNRLEKLRQNLIVNTNAAYISSGSGGPQSVYGIGPTNLSRVVNSVGTFKYFTATGTSRVSTISYSIKSTYLKPNSNNLKDGSRLISSSYHSGFNSANTFLIVAPNKPRINEPFQQYYTLDYLTLKTKATAPSLSTTNIKNFFLNDNGAPLNNDIANTKWIPTQGRFSNGVVIQNYTQTSQHIRTKLSVPDYGKRGKDLRNPLSGSFMSKYAPAGNGMIDPIWKINQTDTEAVDDFIKFMFHDLNTNERFRFRAYIESVSEDFNPNWQEVKILGRADSPYIYQGFERSLSISFKAAALSRGDLMLMWDQLERLAKTTVPKYQADAKMKGPLIKFTLGNWFINTPAFIKSLTYTVDNETPWEINLSDSGIYLNPTEYNVGELPMIVSVQISMQIFGEVRPASTHTQGKVTDITESSHYGAGHLYPLGKNGLRTRRQATLMGNDGLADPEDEDRPAPIAGGADYNQLANNTTAVA